MARRFHFTNGSFALFESAWGMQIVFLPVTRAKEGGVRTDAWPEADGSFVADGIATLALVFNTLPAQIVADPCAR